MLRVMYNNMKSAVDCSRFIRFKINILNWTIVNFSQKWFFFYVLRFNHNISSLTMSLYQCNALLCCNKLSNCTDVHFLRTSFWSSGVSVYLVSACLLRKASISVSEKLRSTPSPNPTAVN